MTPRSGLLAFVTGLALATTACTKDRLTLFDGRAVTSASASSAALGSVRLEWPDATGQTFDVYYARDAAISPATWESLPGGARVESASPPLLLTTASHGLTSGETWYFVVAVSGGSTASPWVSAVPFGAGWNGIALDAIAATHLDPPGGQNGARFGYPVLGAGDLNGDGFGDVAVGAYQYDEGENEEGAVFVFAGGPIGLGSSPIWDDTTCNQASAHCGTGIAIGDFDGDGLLDLADGAADYDSGANAEGDVVMFLGSPSGLSTSTVWDTDSNQGGCNMGRFLANAGDVNGDGKDDLLVPMHGWNGGSPGEGRIVLHLGTASGLTVSSFWDWEPDVAGASAGWGLPSSHGDVDGDGFDDILAGSYRLSNGQTNEGAAGVFFGAASGPPIGGLPGWSFESDQANANLGAALALADVNGDSYSDIVVGAEHFDAAQTDGGRVFLFLGSPTGPPPVPDWTFDGEQAGEGFGTAVASAGDVNDDGYDDVVVGAAWFDGAAGASTGRAHLFLGGPDGLAASPAWTIEGGVASQTLGGAVGSAGDVDGDGRDDVVIGVQGDSSFASTVGSVDLFLSPAPSGPLLAVPAGLSGAQGAALALTGATFGDPKTTTAHTCHIDWGDGTPEALLTACTPAALATATHTWQVGSFTVRVRVENGYGLYAEGSMLATVAAP